MERAELERLRRAATQLRAEATEAAARAEERERDLRRAVERLERTEAELRRQVVAARGDRDRWKERADDAQRRLADLERRYDRLRRRRAVRVALALAAPLRPLFSLRRRSRRGAPRAEQPARPPDAGDPGAATMRDLGRRLRRADHIGNAESPGPRVSIVVLNRDGKDFLARLLRGLDTTTYAEFELVVVDNASTDGSTEYLAGLRPRFPLTVLRNDTNVSFAAGCNQGVAAGTGDLVLLMNNDVEPASPGWLAHMVDTLVGEGAGAVGARLVYPHRPGLDPGDAVAPDLTLQHRGVDFRHGDDGMPWPRNLGGGEPPLDDRAGEVRDVAAVTAACMLVRRDLYNAVGGVDEGYFYGTEDVDFCLKLLAAGQRIVYDGRAVLWHHELGTQSREGGGFRARNHRHNRLRFVDRWGPRLFREVFTDRLHDRRVWSEQPLRVAVTCGAGDGDDPLGLARCGWETLPLRRDTDGWAPVPPDQDVVVVRHTDVDVAAAPPGVVRVGWVDDPDGWVGQACVDDLDLLVVACGDEEFGRRHTKRPWVRSSATDPAGVLRDVLARWAAATRVAVVAGGGDAVARGLRRELERRGMPTRLVGGADRDALHAARDDIVVDLSGAGTPPLRSGQVKLRWVLAPDQPPEPDSVSGYDAVLAASRGDAADLADKLAAPVRHLPAATDPERFSPAPGGAGHEVLYVGDVPPGRRRQAVDDLLPTTRALGIYGRGWFPELVDPRHVAGDVVPPGELPALYTAAGVVLVDHDPYRRRRGYVSHRVYDAVASGGFVVCDDVAGVAEEFDGGVVAYRSREELLALLDRYLADPAARRDVAERGRAAVLARHCFHHRADVLEEIAGPLLARRRAWIRPQAPPHPATAGAAPADATGS